MKTTITSGGHTYTFDKREYPSTFRGEDFVEVRATIFNENGDSVDAVYERVFGGPKRATVNWSAHGAKSPFHAAQYADLIRFAALWIAAHQASVEISNTKAHDGRAYQVADTETYDGTAYQVTDARTNNGTSHQITNARANDG